MLGEADIAVLDRVAPEVFDDALEPRLTAEFLADPRHHIAVALADEVVVGFASAVHYVHPDKPSELWINEVGVTPSRHREGIGRELLRVLLDHARELGCAEAWVLTERDNEAARGLYVASGGAEETMVYATFDLTGARPSVRRYEPDEWPAYKSLRLRSLAESPDAFGSTLEREQGFSDEVWASRLTDGVAAGTSLPLVAERDGSPVGLASGRIDPATPERADVYQMWVAPEARGAGIGAMLLDAVIAWARDSSASNLFLAVSCGDTPARRLYERAGFAAVGAPSPLRPGSQVEAQEMRLSVAAP